MLCRFFALEIFSLLLRKQLINQNLVQKILQWRHTGFNVHRKVGTESKEETEGVGKYMIRPILSLKKLSLDEVEGKLSTTEKRNSYISNHFVQFSIFSLGTLLNSFSLFVTRIQPKERACAAIKVSSAPIGVPCFSN